MVKNLRIEEFDYPLPDDRIARYPLAQRDSCKLLMRRADGSVSDHVFTELPGLLPMDAMLVYNNTRVINARLRFRKPEGATIEIFCLEPVEPRDYAVSFAQNGRCPNDGNMALLKCSSPQQGNLSHSRPNVFPKKEMHRRWNSHGIIMKSRFPK